MGQSPGGSSVAAAGVVVEPLEYGSTVPAASRGPPVPWCFVKDYEGYDRARRYRREEGDAMKSIVPIAAVAVVVLLLVLLIPFLFGG